MASQWYAYSEIRYTKDQILFLLENVSLLREGFWPPNPRESGYVGSSKKVFKSDGKFVKPIIIITELDVRLSLCGKNGQYGKMVEARYIVGWEDEEIAKLARCSTWYVDKYIKITLKYLIGNHRRHCTLDEWVRCGKKHWKECEICEKEER